jgi:hypothetical protein
MGSRNFAPKCKDDRLVRTIGGLIYRVIYKRVPKEYLSTPKENLMIPDGGKGFWRMEQVTHPHQSPSEPHTDSREP